MGVDFLDLGFRVEKKFGIKLAEGDFLRFVVDGKFDLTAGDLHELICEKCRMQNAPLPRSSWRELQIILAKTLGMSPWKVHRQSLLIKDLGMD